MSQFTVRDTICWLQTALEMRHPGDVHVLTDGKLFYAYAKGAAGEDWAYEPACESALTIAELANNLGGSGYKAWASLGDVLDSFGKGAWDAVREPQ